jgi:hypothetical protein
VARAAQLYGHWTAQHQQQRHHRGYWRQHAVLILAAMLVCYLCRKRVVFTLRI